MKLIFGQSLLICFLFDSYVTARAEGVGSFPIWFASWQHTGHIKGLCPIALELQGRGWEVRLLVHEEMLHVAPAELQTVSAGSLPWSWDQELDYRQSLWDPSPTQNQTPEQDNQRAELSERYFLGSQQSLAQGVNASLQAARRSDWPGLFVIDVSSVGVMDLAEQLNLPFVVVSTWPVGPTLQSIADPSRFAFSWMPSEMFIFTQSAEQQGFGDRLKRAAVNTLLPKYMEFAGFHKPRREFRRSLGLSERIELLEAPKLAPTFPNPLIVVLSHWGLDRPRPIPPNIVLVGPVENYTARAHAVAPLPGSLKHWLTKVKVKQHIVYVSFGTNVQARPQLLREMMKGMAKLEKDNYYFIWDLSPEHLQNVMEVPDLADLDDGGASPGAGHERAEGAALLEAQPDNLLLVPGVSQLAVLATGRIEVFVSHCGLNSVHEAMHFGIPVVGVPFLGDQLISARLIAEAKAGVPLPPRRLTESTFTDAVRNARGFATGARRVGHLGARAGGARAAADAIEGVAMHGTDHLQTIKDTHPGSDRVWDVVAVPIIVLVCLVALLCAAFRNDAREKTD